MKILVLGADGRAHALVWKLFNSTAADVLCAPGNGGTGQLAPAVDLDPGDVVEVARWAFAAGVDLIIPADSRPLWAGLVDEVVSTHIGVCGASQRSTRLEWSRCSAKEFLLKYALPTPHGRAFASLPIAEKYLAAQPLPVVLRADHPAGGEGVFHDRYAALEALRRLFVDRPVEGSSHGVVIEEHLPGVVVSCSALTDGTTALPFLPTRIYDGLGPEPDSGAAPGMGAICSNSAYAKRLGAYLHAHMIQPIVAAMAREGLPYWGVIGVDCIITEQGPRVAALRCGLRDMEAQVMLPRLEDDLVPLVQAAIARRLDRVPGLTWRDEASVGIAVVSQGYPHHYPVGGQVDGLADIDEGVLVFHDQTESATGLRYAPQPRAGSMLGNLIFGTGPSAGGLSVTGGHVLTVVARGATLHGARGRALVNAERVRFPGRHFREDIGAYEFK